MLNGLIRAPRLRSQVKGEETRHANWLELFVDLIFVVAVTQLARRLTHGITAATLVSFVALFLPVWWSWIGTTFYASRFIAADDLLYRCLAVIEMCGVAALGLGVRDGFGTTARGFALAYAIVRAVLVVQYVRAGRAVPEARPLANRFARGFALAAVIWAIAAFTPSAVRVALCGVGLAVDIGTPLFAGRLHTDTAPNDSHLPERFGQFTLIVLGEGVATVVLGIGQRALTVAEVVSAVCALVMAFCLAWLYFENLDGSAINAAQGEGRVATYLIWLYSHFPLVVALTALGPSVQYVVTNPSGAALPTRTRWLTCVALALCLITIGIQHWTSAPPAARAVERARARLRLLAGILILLFALITVHRPPVLVMAFLATICAIQVVIDLRNDGEITEQGEPDTADEGV